MKNIDMNAWGNNKPNKKMGDNPTSITPQIGEITLVYLQWKIMWPPKISIDICYIVMGEAWTHMGSRKEHLLWFIDMKSPESTNL